MTFDFINGIIGLVILAFSVILHEVAHGFVADKLGDPTARLYGRLTLDPRKHIDPIMTILLPLVLIITGSSVIFGAAKPVPVDPFNLREGRKDLALVSLAGPLTNILLALLATGIVKMLFAFSPEAPMEIANILFMMITYNISLAVLNLFPIPPLDGSKVFALLLPERTANVYLSFGGFGIGSMFAIYLLLFFFSPLISTLNTFAIRLLGF